MSLAHRVHSPELALDPPSRLAGAGGDDSISGHGAGTSARPIADTGCAFVGNAGFQAEATRAQRRSLVVLENRDRILPLGRRVSDAALLDVLMGRASPEGRLPFDLPSSMADVERQQPGRPFDTTNPLYRFGFGRRY